MLSKLRIATRQSKLALIQANLVKQALLKFYPNLKIEIISILSFGDKNLDKNLIKYGGKGVFITELESALKNNTADLAVHSMKDVPYNVAPEFKVIPVLERGPVNDVLVTNNNFSLNELPKNSLIGTSSLRRKLQLLSLRPDLNINWIRGNVDTRIRKIHNNLYDAVILAQAGLERLNYNNYINYIFPLKQMIPALGQGIIAAECLANNYKIIDLLSSLIDPKILISNTLERKFSENLNASCELAIGGYARCDNNKIDFIAYNQGKIFTDSIHPANIKTAISLADKISEKYQ